MRRCVTAWICVCVQSGLTALHIGAFCGHEHIVAELLAPPPRDDVTAAAAVTSSRDRCDVTAATRRGETALHCAARCGQARVARLVLDSVAAASHDDIVNAGTVDVSLCRLHFVTSVNLVTRSTQPCIPPRALNRVPASAGVRAGMSPLPGNTCNK